MNGGKLPAYWRQNFVYYGGYEKHVEQAFSILDTLAAWGGRGARVPRRIAVLRSRASEDWCRCGSATARTATRWTDEGYVYEKWLLSSSSRTAILSTCTTWITPRTSRRRCRNTPSSSSRSLQHEQEAFGAVRRAAEKGRRSWPSTERRDRRVGEPVPQTAAGGHDRRRPGGLHRRRHAHGGALPGVLDKARETLDTMLGSCKPIEVETYGTTWSLPA